MCADVCVHVYVWMCVVRVVWVDVSGMCDVGGTCRYVWYVLGYVTRVMWAVCVAVCDMCGMCGSVWNTVHVVWVGVEY